MAKIKRSELGEPGGADSTQAAGAASQSAVPPAAPGAARDPRDATIASLRLSLVIVSLIAVALAATVLVMAIRWTGPATPATPATTPAGTPATPPASAPAATPPATTAPQFGANYVQVSPTAVKAGAIVVEIHTDYQCPWCMKADLIYGDALKQLADAGEIDLRIHIRTIIGDNMIHNDSSERAGLGAVCADRLGYFWGYHTAIFNSRTPEGNGFTEEQLRGTFATEAGMSGQTLTDFLACYDTGAGSAQVRAMEQEGAAAGINGTPTFFVNGIKVNFDLQPDHPTDFTTIAAADLLAELQRVAGG